jgi:hypothetical protein
LDQLDIFGVGLGAADFDEAAAHLSENEVRAKGDHGVQLSVVPGAFQELEHQHAHAVANRTQGSAQSGGGLAFAGAGIDEEKYTTELGHDGFQATGSEKTESPRAFGPNAGALGQRRRAFCPLFSVHRDKGGQ